MQMTNSEIAVQFRQARNRRKQVTILAELNCCTVEEIADIIRSEITDGRMLKCLPPKKTEAPKLPAEPDPLEEAIAVIQARLRELTEIIDTAERERSSIYDRLSKLDKS